MIDFLKPVGISLVKWNYLETLIKCLCLLTKSDLLFNYIILQSWNIHLSLDSLTFMRSKMQGKLKVEVKKRGLQEENDSLVAIKSQFPYIKI